MLQKFLKIQEDVEDVFSNVKIRNMTKIKLMKELNHKSNCASQDVRFMSNVHINPELIFKTSRNLTKNSSELSTQSETSCSLMNSSKHFSKIKKLDGDVQFTDFYGNKFKGFYQNGIRLQGKMIYHEGKCEYEGSFFRQKFNGHGKLTYKDGRTIEGEWQNQVFVGKALINYPNGDVYYGDVNKKLYRHGKGHLFLKNGGKYIGKFDNGSLTGQGTFYRDENVVMRGQWLRGKLIRQMSSDESFQQSDEDISNSKEDTSIQNSETRENQNSNINKQQDNHLSEQKQARKKSNQSLNNDSFVKGNHSNLLFLNLFKK